MHKPLTVSEKKRLAELVEAGTPIGEICEVIGRDRWTTRRNINYLAHDCASPFVGVRSDRDGTLARVHSDRPALDRPLPSRGTLRRRRSTRVAPTTSTSIQPSSESRIWPLARKIADW
mgnify:CR=1 FL=1